MYEKETLSKFKEHSIEFVNLFCDPSAVTVCPVCAANTAKGKRYEVETSAPCFLDSWSLTSPRALSEWFLIFFFNVGWQGCRSVSFFHPLLDMSTDRTMLCWSWKAANRGKWVMLYGFISALSHSLLFSMALWSFLVFHSKLVPVYPVPTGTLLLNKYFANNILAVSEFSSTVPFILSGYKVDCSKSHCWILLIQAWRLSFKFSLFIDRFTKHLYSRVQSFSKEFFIR